MHPALRLEASFITDYTEFQLRPEGWSRGFVVSAHEQAAPGVITPFYRFDGSTVPHGALNFSTGRHLSSAAYSKGYWNATGSTGARSLHIPLAQQGSGLNSVTIDAHLKRDPETAADAVYAGLDAGMDRDDGSHQHPAPSDSPAFDKPWQLVWPEHRSRALLHLNAQQHRSRPSQQAHRKSGRQHGHMVLGRGLTGAEGTSSVGSLQQDQQQQQPQQSQHSQQKEQQQQHPLVLVMHLHLDRDSARG